MVALIAVLGWVFWQNFIQKQDTADEVNSTAKVEDTPKTNDTTSQEPTGAQQYLVVQSWGVKLPLADTITDATYTVRENGAVLLSTKRIDTFCQEKGWTGCSVGTISRGKAGESIDPSGTTFDASITYDITGTRVGDYYYI